MLPTTTLPKRGLRAPGPRGRLRSLAVWVGAVALVVAACGRSSQPQRGAGKGQRGQQQQKEPKEGAKRDAALKKMTSSRKNMKAAVGSRGAVLPKGGPGGGTPQLPSNPVQRIVAEVRSAVLGEPDPSAGQRRNPSQLPGIGLQRGAFVTSDTGYTFRPCGSKTLYLIRGNQEVIYLLNERLRFSSRALRNPFFVQLEGRLMEMDQLGGGGGGGGAGGAGQAQGAGGGAGGPGGGRRRPTGPQFMVTKFVSMEAKFPQDCPSPSRL